MIQKILSLLKTDVMRNFLIYSFGALFLKGISFLLIPLYTNVLSPGEYGNLELLSNFGNIIEIFVSLGLAQLFVMNYFHYDGEARRKMVINILSVYLLISTSLYVIILFVLRFYYDQVFSGISYLLVVLIIVISYFNFFQSILVQALRLAMQAAQATVLIVITGVTSLALNVYFVYFLNAGIKGILFSSAFVLFISFSYGLYLYNKKIGFSFKSASATDVTHILKSSLPFIPNLIAFWLMSSANRWILYNYASIEEVGYFSLAVKFSSLFDPLMIQPFLSSYSPKMMQQFKSGNYSQPLRKYFFMSLLIFGFAAVVLYLVAAWVVDEKFHDALPLIPILVFSMVFYFFMQLRSVYLLYSKKVRFMLYAVSFAGVICIGLNFLLVPGFGATGAAISAVAGNMAWMAAVFYFARISNRKND